MTRRTVIILALMAAVGLAGLWLVLQALPAADTGPSSAGTAAGAPPGGPFTLVDNTGKTVHDTDFRGKYLLIFFGYTFCPDVCPTALQEIAAGLDALGSDAAKVQPLFITIDPERDTQAVLAHYVAAFDPRIVGLTGTPEQIAAVAKAYHVYYAKSDPSNTGKDYLMDHSAFIYLMGPDGQYLTVMSFQASAEDIVKAVRSYL